MSTTGAPPMPSSSGSGRAPRGSACLACRRRKLRCDGVRPVCGQCVRGNRQHDCEYTDGSTRGPTQILEDEIARLEARIYELEHPESVTAPVLLHAPSASSSVMPSSSSSLAHRDTPAPPAPPATEPPFHMLQALVNSFLPHAPQVGFFLHGRCLNQALSVADPQMRNALLSPAMQNSLYLWGTHLSDDAALRSHEAAFLSRAAQATSVALSHTPTGRIAQIIQAEVLLATYYFAVGRMLEGRYHCSAAVALVLSTQLNKLRSAQGPPGQLGAGARLDVTLPRAVDASEEGERINAFWTVFVLDKIWSTALGGVSHINGGSMIDTPWPLNVEEYEQGGLPQNVVGLRTMESFFNNVPSISGAGMSPLALRAKAAAVYDRASRLASQFNPNVANPDQFFAQVFALDALIDHLIATLPYPAPTNSVQDNLHLLVIHTLTRTATMLIYPAAADRQGQLVMGKDVAAAKAAVGVLASIDLTQVTFADPILAMLWGTICRVLLQEYARTRSGWISSLPAGYFPPGTDPLQIVQAAQHELGGMVQRVLGVMATFGHTAPLMTTEAAKIRDEFDQARR